MISEQCQSPFAWLPAVATADNANLVLALRSTSNGWQHQSANELSRERYLEMDQSFVDRTRKLGTQRVVIEGHLRAEAIRLEVGASRGLRPMSVDPSVPVISRLALPAPQRQSFRDDRIGDLHVLRRALMAIVALVRPGDRDPRTTRSSGYITTTAAGFSSSICGGRLRRRAGRLLASAAAVSFGDEGLPGVTTIWHLRMLRASRTQRGALNYGETLNIWLNAVDVAARSTAPASIGVPCSVGENNPVLAFLGSESPSAAPAISGRSRSRVTAAIGSASVHVGAASAIAGTRRAGESAAVRTSRVVWLGSCGRRAATIRAHDRRHEQPAFVNAVRPMVQAWRQLQRELDLFDASSPCQCAGSVEYDGPGSSFHDGRFLSADERAGVSAERAGHLRAEILKVSADAECRAAAAEAPPLHRQGTPGVPISP